MIKDRLKQLAIVVTGVLAITLVAACTTSGEAATDVTDSYQTASPTLGSVHGPELPPGWGGAAAGSPMLSVANDKPVIWVAGRGQVDVEPDVAILELGVEVTLPTVAEARAEAATAVNMVTEALTAAGVEDRDVQTQRFRISPRFEWSEVEENGVRTSRETLVGYRLSNTLAVKVRDLDTVSQVIDDVIAAGGDAIRFRNLRFTVDDTSPLMAQLREDAVTDAKDKAQHYADLAGLTLGGAVYMAEPGVTAIGSGNESYYLPQAASASAAFALESSGISRGELEVSLAINMAFSVQ